MVANQESFSLAWTSEDSELINELAYAIMEIGEKRKATLISVFGALDFVKYRLMEISDSRDDTD